MTNENQELLQKIVDRINGRENYRESEYNHFWDIVSALRGPDMPDSQELKKATTAVIRKKLGINPGLLDVNGDSEQFVAIRQNLSTKVFQDYDPTFSYHFLNHARNAFNALGLKWDEVNDV